MHRKLPAIAALLCVIASRSIAAPAVTVVPGGLQLGNWIWTVTVTPDLTLIPDGSGTPLALELGFRLSGGSLISVTNINPS